MTRRDGSLREIPAQRVALLALLCAAGDRGVSRDRAVSLLWPERPDENARHSLGQSLYALRRDAESADVVLGTATLVLNPAVVACDAWELDVAAREGDAERAIALYGGPFLDGVHVRGSAELQQTVEAEALRLHTLFAGAVESLARRAASTGDAATAAHWWRRLAAADAYSSRVALELVRALAAGGDRVAALQAARVHETLLREQLDVEPDAELARLVNELRSDAMSLASMAVTGGEVVPRAIPDPPSSTGPLVEPNVDTDSGPPPRKRSTTWLVVASLAGVASVALLIGATWRVGTTPDIDTARVYVASFENRTGDRALDPLGRMASDWVSQGLERTGVVAVGSFARAERDEPSFEPRDASHHARELGAGTIVSGAYYKVGDQLRFHVQVGDVVRGEVLDSFDAVTGPASDPAVALETVRQRAMGSLASLVDPRLSSWVRVASKPPTYQAYREFVAGQSLWGTDRRRALGHFVSAATLDSTFHAARVEAAILHRLLDECERTEAIATELSRVRDRLAPYDYHVLEAQVAQCHGEWERSYRNARAVADRRPGSAFLEYSVALQAMQLGRYREARALLGRHALARGVAEVGPSYGVVYAQVLAALGDRRDALDVTRWLRTRHATFARAWGTELVLSARDGRVEDVEQLIDTMTTLPLVPSSAVSSVLRRAAAAFQARGDSAAARRTGMRALALLDTESADGLQRESERAELLYELGRFDEARALLATLVARDSANVELRGYVGMLAARCGQDATAREVDVWLRTARTPYTFTRTLYRARIAALLGQEDSALTLLAKGLDETGRFMLPAIREYNEFASLRRSERFERLTTLR